MKDLAKRKLGQLSKALETAQAAFMSEIDKLAEQARAEILPYFRDHDFDFKAGNGDWLILRSGVSPHDQFVHDAELPANIRALLMLEVAHGDHLGFYVRDIKRGEW